MALPRPSDWWHSLSGRIGRRLGFAPREREMRKLAAVIDRELGQFGFPQWEDYLHELDSRALDSAIWQSLLRHILIGETSFFRQTQQFDLVRDTILRPRHRRPSCWCAGCATGEEPFSLGIVCNEEGRRADIWGTDISRAALSLASRGNVSSRRGAKDPRVARWIRETPDGPYMRDAVRSLIRWQWVNLLDAEEFVLRNGPFDLIMCRNVLIYFHDEAVDRVLKLFERALAPDGRLMLGHAESLLFRKTAFHMVAGGLAYTKTPPPNEPPVPRGPAAREAPEEPSDPQDVVKRAVALEGQNRFAEAARVLRDALAEQDGNILARLCLSGVYRRSGQIDAAARELDVLAGHLARFSDDEGIPGGNGLTVGALRSVIAPYAERGGS